MTTAPVLIDFESRSRADLRKIGGRAYWRDPSSEALVVVWYDTATGDAGAWTPRDVWPHRGRVLAAHNAHGFDRFAAERYGFDAAGWIDTSQIARKAGLPGALDALGTRWAGVAKDDDGSRFTRALSTVRRPTKRTAGDAAVDAATWAALTPDERRRRGVLPTVDDATLARVTRYCANDVAIMAATWPRLAAWTTVDVDVERVDRVVNDRGIAFDSALARRLLDADAALAARAVADAARVIGADPAAVRAAASSPAQFVELTGAPDAQSATVDAMLADAATTAPVRALAIARKALSSIAAGKLEAGLARVGPDGRLRDNLRYYGAHTGRWSGQGMQLQNLPRPAARLADVNVDTLADAVACGTYAPDADEIALLVRATLTATPGTHALVACDFASVEARATAWSAGDDAAVDVFRSTRDPYKVAATAVFAVAYDDVTKAQRQVGKVAELACLSGATEVLTPRGWVPLLDLRASDRLWDGVEWIEHGGVIAKGERCTISLKGLRLTSEHEVWCGDAWRKAGSLRPCTIAQALAIASESLPLSTSDSVLAADCSPSWCNARAVHRRMPSLCTTCEEALLLGATCARKSSRATGGSNTGATPTFAPTTGTGAVCSIAFPPPRNVARTHARNSITRTAHAAFTSTPRGCTTARHSCAICLRSTDGTIPRSSLTESTTTEGTSRGTYVSSRTSATKRTSARSKSYSRRCSRCEPVFDVAHVGPRNRFTVRTDAGPLIVHNCGYGGGPNAFAKMARAYRVDLDGVDVRAVVTAWRDLHRPVVGLWYACERAFRAAVDGRRAWAGPFEFVHADVDDAIACFLPSGRPIVYHEPRVSAEGALEYHGTRGREHVYGGKLVENAVQALCRDLMADALVRVERAGLAPVLHVHDEIVCDVPSADAGAAARALRDAMLELPAWAAGFPVDADGWTGRRYRK